MFSMCNTCIVILHREFLADVILHMTMEALLWGIVPTVSSTGHGLTQLLILQYVDEAITGVVAPLVTMDHRLGVK